MLIAMPYHLNRHRHSIAVFLAVLLCICSCKKNNNTTTPQNKAEVKATVTLSSGSVVTINASGDKATVTRDIFGYTYVFGSNQANAGVNLMFPNVTSLGTYSYLCEYRV